MDKDERSERAAAIREAAEIFARQEGKTLEEKLREDGATEEEIRDLLGSDPADEPWNSEDTKVLLGWLGVLVAAAILVIVVLIMVV